MPSSPRGEAVRSDAARGEDAAGLGRGGRGRHGPGLRGRQRGGVRGAGRGPDVHGRGRPVRRRLRAAPRLRAAGRAAGAPAPRRGMAVAARGDRDRPGAVQRRPGAGRPARRARPCSAWRWRVSRRCWRWAARSWKGAGPGPASWRRLSWSPAAPPWCRARAARTRQAWSGPWSCWAARPASPCWPCRCSAGSARLVSRCTPPGWPRSCSPRSGRSGRGPAAVLRLRAADWLADGYLAVAVTAVAFVLWYSSVRRLGASRAGLLHRAGPDGGRRGRDRAGRPRATAARLGRPGRGRGGAGPRPAARPLPGPAVVSGIVQAVRLIMPAISLELKARIVLVRMLPVAPT